MCSPLVVHSVPTARPSAVDNQRLAWAGGGGWGGAPSVDGRTPLEGCPARPQWARRAIGRGRGPDHSIGAQSVAPRLWTAPLSKDGLGRHRPRAGAERFAAVAQTVCAPPVEGAAHTGGWVNPPVWVRPSWPCRTRASTEPAPCRMLLPTAAYAAMRNRHAPRQRDISVDPRRATPHLGGSPDRGKAAPNLPPNAHRKEREQ